tara:strand:+ start:370 stop:627 length:258 start_codon:yes stop_codon:yes gene_type:complete
MEIILTVLITLMVVALTGAGISLIRLNNKVQKIEVLERDIESINHDVQDRINGVISSTDRRFDKLYDELGKLDSIVNPNKDILKG